ncbi:MAG: VCBS repeat-containing protein [Nitrospirae bacterium]|nr:VCBS repeat-containing protein [Nitrospirota bacterium]
MRDKVKIYLLLAAVIAIFVNGCSLNKVSQDADHADLGPIVSTTLPDAVTGKELEARDMVLDYFNPLNGVIEKIENSVVKVRLEQAHVKKGIRLSVFRESRPFYHPVTNELIGNADDFAGRIEVIEENAVDGLYLCGIVSGDIKEGDKVRISSSRIKLAFFQDRNADWSVSETFNGALKDSGRFDIVELYTPDYKPETLSKLARGHGAEAVLMFSTPEEDGKIMLKVNLYWTEDAKLFGELEKTSQNAAASAPDEEFISRTFKDAELWQRYQLPGGQLIAMGDVDGNGTDEFVASDGRSIRIYAVKEELQEIWKIKADGGTHLSMDILDLNNNGRAEIFVTSAVDPGTINTGDGEIFSNEIRASSFVIEYDPSGGYKRIDDNIPFFLRVMGKALLMQRVSRDAIFSGPVYNGVWKDMHYKPDGPLGLPDKANIYGFTYVDWKNEGRFDLMTYDDLGYLYLYDAEGHLKWRSDDSYGPFALTFESRTRSIATPKVKWSVRSRLAIIKTGRGQEVVAISRKPRLTGLPGLGANEVDVYSLSWDEGVMKENLVLGKVPGSVTDFWIQGSELFLVASGDFNSLISNVTEGEFSISSILYYYNFAPKDKQEVKERGK